MATTNTNHVTKAEMEKYLSKILEIRLRQAIEEYAARNEMHLKELSLLERIVRVEEELKALRQMSEIKFEASEKRFEALQREMKAGFEASEKRFESLQREMNARFEAMDKRFSVIQWMIGILVGIPAIAITLIQVIGALK